MDSDIRVFYSWQFPVESAWDEVNHMIRMMIPAPFDEGQSHYSLPNYYDRCPQA